MSWYFSMIIKQVSPTFHLPSYSNGIETSLVCLAVCTHILGRVLYLEPIYPLCVAEILPSITSMPMYCRLSEHDSRKIDRNSVFKDTLMLQKHLIDVVVFNILCRIRTKVLVPYLQCTFNLISTTHDEWL